ncbi:MAG TPA: TolC family protein [Bacteroidales bacterium]|jgi:outer membrane protein TolC|nr:TolC family protein [Bacteroidales bacterium]HQJ81350.1 TolC family protein [Bacteroidales bacterium]
MKRKVLLISLLILYGALSLYPQKIYSLNDCIYTGLERNYSLLITRNTETIAKNNFSPGNAGFLPSVDLSGRHSGTYNDSKQNLRDGTQNISRDIFNTSSSAGINLGMTIFRGFSVQTTYKKLNELQQIGELNTQLAVENLVAGIISGYYTYIQQLRLLNTLQYAVTLSRERLRIDEDRYLLGSSSKLQVLQSRVYLNADSSRLSRQGEVVRAARIRLNELMSVPDPGELFSTSDTSIYINPDLIYENLLDDTLIKNTSLQIASKNRVVSEYDYKLASSRSYPYLNMTSGYSYNFNSFSSGVSANQATSGVNYGLTLGMNLFDGFNQRRSIRNSLIELENKDLRYQDIEQGVRADLLTMYSAYSNYLRLVTLEEQNLQTASENLAIAMERYKLGSLSGLDLREVQKSLLDARESLLSVQYQTKLAEISLLLISGRIMDYYQ